MWLTCTIFVCIPYKQVLSRCGWSCTNNYAPFRAKSNTDAHVWSMAINSNILNLLITYCTFNFNLSRRVGKSQQCHFGIAVVMNPQTNPHNISPVFLFSHSSFSLVISPVSHFVCAWSATTLFPTWFALLKGPFFTGPFVKGPLFTGPLRTPLAKCFISVWLSTFVMPFSLRSSSLTGSSDSLLTSSTYQIYKTKSHENLRLRHPQNVL